jgi:hypothetical protein
LDKSALNILTKLFAMQKTTYKATMWLPSDGKQYWSTIMYGEAELPSDLNQGDIIVAAYACFDDGTQVIGGVKKGDSEAYNIKFFTVLDASGKAYPGYPLDCSDHEDFLHTRYIFNLNDDESIEYQLTIAEKA